MNTQCNIYAYVCVVCRCTMYDVLKLVQRRYHQLCTYELMLAFVRALHTNMYGTYSTTVSNLYTMYIASTSLYAYTYIHLYMLIICICILLRITSHTAQVLSA